MAEYYHQQRGPIEISPIEIRWLHGRRRFFQVVAPDSVEAACGICLLYADQAIEDFNEAIRLDPSDAEAYHGRGDVRLRQKRFNEAIGDYRKSIELKPIDASAAWNQCRISASWTGAFFNCTRVADDMSQPADNRAEAQRRLDAVMGRGATPR